jgi:hypothetical protein
VRIVDTGIWQLNPSYQGIYVQAVADAYAADGDAGLAGYRLSFICQEAEGLATIFGTAEQALQASAEINGVFDAGRQANLDTLKSVPVTQNPDAPVCDAGSANRGITSLLGPIGVILLGMIIVGAGLFSIIRGGGESSAVSTYVPPASLSTAPPATTGEQRDKATQPTITPRGQPGPPPRSAAQAGAQMSAAAEKTDFTSQGQRPPVIQFMTTYLQGDDLYDDSFSIETPSGDFLGECGVGIAEALTEEGKKRVQAFEVWLFDKNDIRTVTKVLMSESAFNNESIRAKLAPKGEAVLVKNGDRIGLETASLRIQARIVDMGYMPGTTPANNIMDRITIELAAWKKDGA